MPETGPINPERDKMKDPSTRALRSPQTRSRHLLGTLVASGLAVCIGTVAGTGVSSATPRPDASQQALVVWSDSTRVPFIKAYEKAFPNVKIDLVTYDGDANGDGTMEAKVALFNRVGHGWPDVIFSEQNTDIAALGDPQLHYAGALNKLVPQSVINGFAKGSLADCYIGTQLLCLRNDLAFDVLWYNASLMKQFGYTVPTTWQQWQALGKKVATQHPGYIIGTLGNSYDDTIYLQAAQCPANQLLNATTLLVNTASPNCTRVASLLDPLVKDGSVPVTGVFTSTFTKKYTGKVLTMVGPAWYGAYLFQPSTGLNTPKGQLAAAAPLSWGGGSTYTGDVGGGLWIMSSHTTQPKAAASLLTWLATSWTAQSISSGYPAYAPVAGKWIAEQDSSGYYASPLAKVFASAAPEVWTGWSPVRYSTDAVWNSTVTPALTEGKTLASQLPNFGAQLKNYAQSDGYTVVSKP
jgi:ABC-type glycerol-3-phosphate transport system substrate-binding protein